MRLYLARSSRGRAAENGTRSNSGLLLIARRRSECEARLPSCVSSIAQASATWAETPPSTREATALGGEMRSFHNPCRGEKRIRPPLLTKAPRKWGFSFDSDLSRWAPASVKAVRRSRGEGSGDAAARRARGPRGEGGRAAEADPDGGPRSCHGRRNQ